MLPAGTWSAAPAAAVDDPTDSVAAPDGLDDEARRVLTALAYRSAGVDEVVERTGLTADSVSSILLALELRGLVAPTLGGAFSRVAKRP